MGIQETSIFDKFKDVFKNNKVPVKGDEGVLQDVITFLSSNDTTDALKHNIFVKVKVIEVYNNLVEIEVLDIIVSDSASECFINLITASVPKFIKPKNITWKNN
jgi:hypothetical protein